MSNDTIKITYRKSQCNELMEMLFKLPDEEQPGKKVITIRGDNNHLVQLPMKSIIAARFGTTKGVIYGKTYNFLVINRDGGRDIKISCE